MKLNLQLCATKGSEAFHCPEALFPKGRGVRGGGGGGGGEGSGDICVTV